MLGILGKTEQEQAIHETADSSTKAETAKRFALGGGWSIGLAVVFGAFELLRSNPHDAFPLLISWGPKAIGALILIYVVYDLARIVINYIGRAVFAVEKLAVAQQRNADKDDRQAEELQRMTTFSVQTSQRAVELGQETLAEMRKMNEKLQQVLVGRRGHNDA